MNSITVKLLYFVQFNLILFVVFLGKLCIGNSWAHLRSLILRACFGWLSPSWLLGDCCFFYFEKDFSDELATVVIILDLERPGDDMLLLEDWTSCSSTGTSGRPFKESLMHFIFSRGGLPLSSWALHRRLSFIGWPLTHLTCSLRCVIIRLSVVLGVMYRTLESTALFLSVMSHLLLELL